MSRRGLRRFSTVTGTGLAQPNRNSGPPKIKLERISSSGISTVPIGSMCLIGLRVIRPSLCAVLSPSRLAIQPWAASWSVMANSSGIAITTTS